MKRVCCQCKQEKPVSDFYTDASVRGGLKRRCKECYCANALARPESVRVCCQCRQQKPISDFYRRREGHQSRCRLCDNGNRVTRTRVSMAQILGSMGEQGSSGEMTHAEVAAVLGCSRQRVHQIEQTALRKLRIRAERMGLEVYL